MDYTSSKAIIIVILETGGVAASMDVKYIMALLSYTFVPLSSLPLTVRNEDLR